jgi:uncharacterized damage-inducible protein DinB
VACVEAPAAAGGILMLWFERKFSFDFPVEVYPNLRMRLRGTPARMEELVAGLSAEQLTHKPEGKWSIQENAGHLVDLEPLWLARVEDFLQGVEILTAADLTNRKSHEARHNEKPLAEILMAFRRARSALLERLDGLAAGDFARTALHPRLKTPMRLVDHLYFIAEHDDHHLARIWELRSHDS